MTVPFLKVAKLIMGRPIVDDKRGPTADFLRWLNDNNSNIQNAVNQNADMLNDIAYALEQAGIAILTATEIKAEQNLVNSYVDPSSILTASDAGSDATVTIADHDRVYGDGTRVAVTGSTITGLSYSSTYFIYYDDPDHLGGAVTYLYSTVAADAVQGNGRHTVGAVTTPASGGSDTGGSGTDGPGIPYCVTDDTPILLANSKRDGPGREVIAALLKVGDYVWTRHELTGQWGAYPIQAIAFSTEPVYRCAGHNWPRKIRATAKHRFEAVIGYGPGLWAFAEDMGLADGMARVAQITVSDAHTYVSAGVLSHNIKKYTDV